MAEEEVSQHRRMTRKRTRKPKYLLLKKLTLPLIITLSSQYSWLIVQVQAFSVASSRFGGLKPQTITASRTCSAKIHGDYTSGRKSSNIRPGRCGRRQDASSSSSLGMVLRTPESIIEQVSTQALLDDLIDESRVTVPRKPIIIQFDPSSGWLWGRWKGTVFSETWRSCVRNIIIACLISILYKLKPGMMDNLKGFNILWGQLLSVTTFTLTFFLNQSYALWRTCYTHSRRLQGRILDVGLTLSCHASRTQPSEGEGPSTYTESSRQVLELVARYLRVFNLFTYASFAGSHRPVLTPQGMKRLVYRGIITEQERQVLSDMQLPATQRHNAVLTWIMKLFVDARKAGHIECGDGMEQQFLEKIHVIRAQYGAIGDGLQGRMPLAYAHIVQVLVDVILWMYPVMAFSSGMSPFVGAAGTGLLTMFYQGLFDLAKQFLDPYDNENYGKGDDPLCIDTLIAESNAGSVRYLNGFAEQPFDTQKLIHGNMLEYQLPLRGWSVDEAAEREAQIKMEQVKLDHEQVEQEEIIEKIKEVVIVEELERFLGGDEEEVPELGDDLTMEEALEQMDASRFSEKLP